MQIQRAAAQYVQSQTPYASDITYRSFYAGGTVSGVGNTHRVYFPICEAGKTVQIGDYWVNTSSGVQKFSGETFVTNDNPALFETFTGQRLTWIDLSDQHSAAADAGSPWTFTTASSGRSVNNVKGVSVKSRVIWRTNTRWKTAEDVSKLTDNSD